jgi:hypothetical protein
LKLVSESLVDSSITLQAVLLVLLLLRSNYRRYPLLLVYSLIFFAATLAESLVLRAAPDGLKSATYRYVYRTDEVIIDLLLFLMVIMMTYKAMGENPLRAKIGRLLGIVVTGVVLLPFVLFRGPQWFNETSQMLNFGAAIMNLALWTALLGNRKRDSLLLSVSAGLGVAVTGAAITYGLHHFKWASHGTPRQMVDLIKSLAHMGSLLIWCWAFWPATRRTAMPRHAVPSN